MSALREQVGASVHAFLAPRLAAHAHAAGGGRAPANLFESGVLDSLALEGLVAAVEQATGRSIDFIEVDPEALGTVEGIVAELCRVLERR